MDEPTALLPPVSTVSLAELLEKGPLPLQNGLELLSAIADQLARMHAEQRSHGLVTPKLIRVQTSEAGPPVVIFNDSDSEATRDMSEGVDQYALGVLTFQVLLGRYPKPNEALAQAMPDAPPALDRLVSRLMFPRPADRVSIATAQRQFSDLAGGGEGRVRTAPPLEAPPQLKRSVPVGAQFTDPQVAAFTDPQRPAFDDSRGGTAKPPETERAPEPNPFSEDEATAMVADPRPTTPDPPHSPMMDEERTQLELSTARTRKRSRPTERVDPLAPPVAEETREAFEPSRSDLPDHTGEPLVEPRLAPKKRRAREHPSTPMNELLLTAKRQPPWVWAAIGVGFAFFLLLLIALLR
jgi:hypothetical protein